MVCAEAYVAAMLLFHLALIAKPKAHCIAQQTPIPSTLHATALPSSRPIADMLRAATRLAPSLIPRAEAALGTRSMSLAGMKGESRQPGARGGCAALTLKFCLTPLFQCRLR